MGATNRSKTSRVREVTPGLTPANPAFREMRVTSNGLNITPTRTTSKEIRSDRQVTDQILTKLDPDGSIGIELSFASFDNELEEALQGTWIAAPSVTVVTLDTEISDVSATTLTVAATLGTPFKTGHLVYTAGFPTSANNGILSRVASSTSTTIVFPAATFTAETAPIPVGASARVIGFQGAAGDIVATQTGGNAWTSTALDFTTLGLSAGQWIRGGGDIAASQFATAADNGWYRISTIAAQRLSFDIVPAGFAADAGATKSIQAFFGDFLVNGTLQRSVTIERQQQDLAVPSYEYFTGQQIDAFTLSLKAGDVISGEIGYMGMGGSVVTVRASGATDTPANANPVMNAASNVGRLAINGAVVAGPSYVMEMSWEVKNNLAQQPAVGTLFSTGTRNGEIDVSGTLNVYFGDIALLSAVVNDTDTSVMFRAGRSDSVRESYVIDVPAAKLTGTSPVGAKNSDRMFSGNYTAKRHGTLGYTTSVGRYWYLPVAA